MIDNKKYLNRLRTKLDEFYLQVRDFDNKDAAMAAGIEAFMEAGLILGAVSSADLEELIAEQHQSIFGMSLLERLQTAKEEALANGDYDFFDTPAWKRGIR